MFNYIVTVRGKTYLWGSSGITADLQWPLLLVISNAVVGDAIGLGSDGADGSGDYGTVQAGECWTLPLLGLRGVFATCPTDSTVACAILLPQVSP
jgi:hypothetical protein